jgi:AcrR family transcriptional regulator
MPATLTSRPAASPPAAAAPRQRQRQRLSPDERIPQILDAALQEFSAKGYIATRMDDIAARAGLSKGGLYAHFASKEMVFEALIQRSLGSLSLDSDHLVATAANLDDVLQPLLDSLYTQLAAPATMATARLLLSEGHRLPAAAVARRESSLAALLLELEALLNRCAQHGLCRADSVLLREPWLLLSPVVHLMSRQIACQPLTPAELQAGRSAHLALLQELLGPRST